MAALVVFVGRSGGPGARSPTGGTEGPSRIEGFVFDDLVGDRKALSVAAGVGTFDEAGNFTVEDIRKLEVFREGKPPLVARADRGTGTGPQGKRVVRLEGGVEVVDQEAALRVSLPSLEIDQVAGVARSLGEVRIESGTMRGRADAVVYGLEGLPTEVFVLGLQGADGSALEAGHALVADGERRLELTGSVRIAEGGAVLRSERVVLHRGTLGRPERAEVSLGLVVEVTFPDRPMLAATAEGGQVTWREDGEFESLVLEGAAHVEQADSVVDGERIRAQSVPEGGWDLDAEGKVRCRGITRKGDALLEADRVVARTAVGGELLRAEAEGTVRFRSADAVADSARATYRPEDEEYPVVLDSGAGTRARVASGRTRVAAEVIRTDTEGSRLAASGRVEASLLPAVESDRDTVTPGPFRSDEAVHFVAREMRTRAEGRVLSFRGDVRGWQGDRHLSADEVDIDDRTESLDARGNVLTRFPDPARGAEEAAFLQVSSSTLAYRGTQGTAVYDGEVRARQREGWLEGDRIEIDLDRGAGQAIREIRAAGSVRFEYRPGDPQSDDRPARGSADRIRHDPIARVLRLMGDRVPAEIRRPGDRGGTTRGRVLRYELDSGSVQVESSAEGPVP